MMDQDYSKLPKIGDLYKFMDNRLYFIFSEHRHTEYLHKYVDLRSAADEESFYDIMTEHDEFITDIFQEVIIENV